MRPAAGAAMAVVLVSALAGCGSSGNPELEPGRRTAARLAEDADVMGPERWLVTVELADRSVSGQDLVVIEVDPADVACADGSDPDPGRMRAGVGVSVERADNLEVARARPPLIAGSRMVVDC